ncbi:amino acid adenylation domain-containing protein [Micromonospora profundi]|uniref:non-ribosomal peptide synthetase n=1 Tax=Micromonospora profundi TaxID=1420889 RepID=UPI00364B939F
MDTIAHRNGVSPAVALLTMYAMLLSQHDAGPDIAVGVSDRLCRTSTGRGTTVRLRVTAHATFASLLAATDSALRPTADDSCGPGCADVAVRLPNLLFRHSLDVHSPGGPLDSITLGGNRVTAVPTMTPATTEDLRLFVSIHADGLDLDASYNPAVHSATDIATFLERYEHLLHHAGPRKLPVIPLLTASDRLRIAPPPSAQRGREDETVVSNVSPGTVAELVIEQARRTPALPAVDGFTYEGLVRAATGICRRLIDAGVQPGGVVAVTGPRGAMLAAGLLGTWLAGAAYLPVGDRMPAGRLITQLERSGATVVLRTGDSAPAVAGRPVIDAAGADGDPDQAPIVNRHAYVLFTSGSTGEPKGVLITHHSLANLITDMTGRLPISAADHVLWSTSATFDISALELWAPLTVGARVTSVADSTLLDPDEVLDVIADRGITVAQGTPTLWRHVAAAPGQRLRDRLLLVGGEPFPADLAERLLAAGARVHNMYGPTETTIWSTTHTLTSPVPSPVPIGKPISRTFVRVVGDHGHPVFPGVPGELIIGGAGVADGYCQDLPGGRSPFGSDGDERFYRTGDRVRQRADGALEFLGRRDRQVKLNGHRIELAEVEAVLNAHPGVSAAAVVAGTDPSGRARLSAVITASGAGDPATLAAAIRRHTANHLPRVAVPAPLLVLDGLPTTPNGKIDYGSVAALTSRHAATAASRPDAVHDGGADTTTGPSARSGDHETPDDLPRRLLELFRRQTQRPDLAHDGDFFRHGGTVAQALALAERIEQSTGRRVPVTALFRAPTVDTLHRYLTTKEAPGP